MGENSKALTPQTKAKIGFLIEGHIQYTFMNVNEIEKFYSGFLAKMAKEILDLDEAKIFHFMPK